jgi:hypothetical protein
MANCSINHVKFVNFIDGYVETSQLANFIPTFNTSILLEVWLVHELNDIFLSCCSSCILGSSTSRP